MARKSKGKKSRGVSTRSTYFVICEGETEEEYIAFLRNEYRIGITAYRLGQNITQKKITNYLVSKGLSSPTPNSVFIFYDRDHEPTNKKIDSLKDVSLICSNPCIELWFLLHYVDWNRHISCEKCHKNELRKYCSEYEKGKKNLQLETRLRDYVKDAMSRAKKLNDSNGNKNPSSKVFDLIDRLKILE